VALAALAHLAGRGDPALVPTALACLRDGRRSEVGVCIAVFSALARHACQGDAGAMRAISRMITNGSGEVRRAALEALLALAVPGDKATVEAVLPCLRHSDPRVRRDGLRALVRLDSGKDPTAAPAAALCIGDADAEVRRAAERALRKMLRKAPVECQVAVVQAMAASLRSAAFELGFRVKKLLVQIVEVGGQEAMEAIVEHLGPGYARGIAKARGSPGSYPGGLAKEAADPAPPDDSEDSDAYLSGLSAFDSDDVRI